MGGSIEYVDPAEIFTNWPDLLKSSKKALEEDQYKKQLYCSHYGD